MGEVRGFCYVGFSQHVESVCFSGVVGFAYCTTCFYVIVIAFLAVLMGLYSRCYV